MEDKKLIEEVEKMIDEIPCYNCRHNICEKKLINPNELKQSLKELGDKNGSMQVSVQ